MKNLIALLIVFFAGFLIYTFDKPLVEKVFYYSPCDYPVRYKIGVVDKRFQLSRDAFVADASQGANIWNYAMGKKLLEYDTQGDLTVNLVFDQRQSLNNQVNSLENQLSEQKNNLDPQVTQYNQRSEEFKKRIESLNNQIDYWNSKGGAPKDEYEKLIKEQDELKKESEALNIMARQLNQSTRSYNVDVSRLNQTIDTFNQAIKLKPEEGLYNSADNTITIYFTNTKDELIHTLAHEFGHSLTLDHIVRPTALMYPYTTQVTSPSPEDIAALQKHCEKVNIFKLAFNRIAFLIEYYRTHKSVSTQ